jgi:hypothetical protein
MWAMLKSYSFRLIPFKKKNRKSELFETLAWVYEGAQGHIRTLY